MKDLFNQMNTMKVIQTIIETLEAENGHEGALRVVSKVLKQIGAKQMNSSDYKTAIEGSQYLWSALMTLERLAEKTHDPSARKGFFETYAVMRECFVIKQYSEDLDYLAIEAEHFVMDCDSSLDVSEQTHAYIQELLRLKRFHKRE